MEGDPNSPSIAANGQYSMDIGPAGSVSFSTAPLVPPQGVFAMNYCRLAFILLLS